MRRKKDDKRVLRAGNGRQNKSRRIKRDNRQFMSPRNDNYYPRTPHNRRSKKSNGKLVFLMIIALVAFVIGAGIGVSLTFEDNQADDGPHFVNVTKEMTSDLNDTEDVYYDRSADDIDYNQNQTQFAIQNGNTTQ